MEAAVDLLKHWRRRRFSAAATSPLEESDVVTIADAVSMMEEGPNGDDSISSGDDDDGPFFDLEFELPDEERAIHEEPEADAEAEAEEFHFPVSTEVLNGTDDENGNVLLSPSDDLFFKGRLVVPAEAASSETTATSTKHVFLPISIFKSAGANKLRLLISTLKKPRNGEPAGASGGDVGALPSPARQQQREKRQFFTVKFRGEDVPIVSFFTRDGNAAGKLSTSENQQTPTATAEEKAPLSEKLLVLQKFLHKIKPLYTKVHGTEKNTTASNSGGSLPDRKVEAEEVRAAETTAVAKSLKMVHVAGGLRAVCKNLMKNSNKTSSAAVAAVAFSPPAMRRDESLLQQEDGIQSAIAHCKNSLCSSRDQLKSQVAAEHAAEKEDSVLNSPTSE